MNDRVHCGKCGMSFPVEPRFRDGPRPAVVRCPETGCGRSFVDGYGISEVARPYIIRAPLKFDDAHVGKWP